MGTASFGGGSGSIGGGGSGAGGSGGSLMRAIDHLRQISTRLTADHDQPRLTREIIEMLRDRGRAAFVKTLLGDGFADTLLGDLLRIKAVLDDGRWSDVAREFDVQDGARAMEKLCDARIDAAIAAHGQEVDDRSIEHGAAAFRQFLAGAVGGDLNIATQGDHNAIDMAINRTYFKNTIGYFLGDLLGQAIRSDSVIPLGASTGAVDAAADTVAIAAYDRFQTHFVDKDKALPHEALKTLAANYSALVTGR